MRLAANTGALYTLYNISLSFFFYQHRPISLSIVRYTILVRMLAFISRTVSIQKATTNFSLCAQLYYL